MPSNLDLLTGFPPIIDAGVGTLILGSFPSPVSLAAGQYYAHRQNQFWRIMAAITGEPLLELVYGERCQRLLAHRFGLWDIYHRCQRQGALDADIRAAEANDFSQLLSLAPGLRRICFNGRTAGGFERRVEALGYSSCILPSTSPAYTLAFARKLELWRDGLEGASPGTSDTAGGT
jgi:TDG/mug DNA glycosylase family protein